MRKILSVILLPLCVAFSFRLDAASALERVYFNTDRDCYVAGDAMWLSVFCVDPLHGGFSTVSSVAYVELHSAAGLSATCKVALKDGRGGGRLLIPNTVPTGNYRIFAYTSLNADEQGYDFGANARTVSIFNTFTKERVEGGVEVVGEDGYGVAPEGFVSEGLSISTPGNAVKGGTASVRITNTLSEPVTLSLSVASDPGIASPSNPGIDAFVSANASAAEPSYRGARIPDYDGEVIGARIMGVNPARRAEMAGLNAYLSAPSEKATVYMSVADDEGNLNFFTNNIYGQKDLVLEVVHPDTTLGAHLELVSPFVNPSVEAPEPLQICSSLRDKLTGMSVSMQIEKRYASDTLYDYLEIREDPLYMLGTIRYHLDDYTRFPTLEEDIIEFIPQLRVRHTGKGEKEIGVRLEDSVGQFYYSESPALVMLDGTPVFDVGKIFAYDALLVEDIIIYPKPFFLGDKFINGYVDFVTYKKNLPSMTFDDNVRIVSFQGPEMPVAYTCSKANENANYPDYRQLVYWHPILEIGAGGSVTLECAMPAYDGTFKVRAEGLSGSGAPVSARSSFKTGK